LSSSVGLRDAETEPGSGPSPVLPALLLPLLGRELTLRAAAGSGAAKARGASLLPPLLLLSAAVARSSVWLTASLPAG